MIENLITFIESIIVSYGSTGIFWAGFLEEVFAPIPSTLVMMTGGFFILGNDAVSLSSFLKLFLQVVVPVSLGITLGSLFVYSIFYFLGEPALNTFGKYFGITFTDIEKIGERMSKGISDEIFIFIARATPLFPITLVNVFCGLIRYPLIKFVTISFLGVLVRSTIMGFVGWQIGIFHKEVSSQFERIETFLAIGLMFAAIYCVYGIRKKNIQGPLKN